MTGTNQLTRCRRLAVLAIAMSLLAMAVGAGGVAAQTENVTVSEPGQEETGEAVEEQSIVEDSSQEIDETDVSLEEETAVVVTGTGDDVADVDDLGVGVDVDNVVEDALGVTDLF
ncbi:hypothetical protein SAMN05444422_11182 [Halobiforma haloterrestris]|uniref:Uncharacterized protein n=1 Tax=Natronobacterium haloterrestre TaxID=148448 RepID=A0A1I1KEN6_NATHA|nr:hypothetical protein [Halobiforma haloterrestris]SFC59286.1 hypothetical protein SAMN05444422_11182 [Halobiforma haloterrestris]